MIVMAWNRNVDVLSFSSDPSPIIELSCHSSCWILLKLLNLSKLFYMYNSRPLQNKTKLKFDQDFKACWSFGFELQVLNESQSTQSIGSVVPLAMFTLFLFYCKEFQMYFLILLRPPARGRRKLRLKWAKNPFLQLREQHAENWEYLQGLKGKRWGLSNSKPVWAKNLIVLLIKINFISESPFLMLNLWKRQPPIN